jgi:hypothetical protein
MLMQLAEKKKRQRACLHNRGLSCTAFAMADAALQTVVSMCNCL